MTTQSVFWPRWQPKSLPNSVQPLALWQDCAQPASATGGRVPGSSLSYSSAVVLDPAYATGYGLEVLIGIEGIEVLGAGAQAVGLSLDGGHSYLANVAGAYVLMHGEPTYVGTNADVELTAVGLRYGSFKLQGASETLLIDQSAGSPAHSPQGVPDLVVDASGEPLGASGRDTIDITTASIASTVNPLPDVFIHLGVQLANAHVGGPGAAVIVGSAGASVITNTNTGRTTVAFGSGPMRVWGGPGHNTFIVLASANITQDVIYDFKGAGGLKAASPGRDPFVKPGSDLLEVSQALNSTKTNVTHNTSGTLVSFGTGGPSVLLAGVSGFAKADIHWISQS
jgi:hypothetical protein